MFADNDRISWLQLRCQFLLTFLGAGLLWGIREFTGKEGCLGILLGGGILACWSGVLRRQMTVYRNPARYFGKTLAVCIVLIWESYLFLSGGWLVTKVSQLSGEYLVSGVSQTTLAFLFVLAAMGGAHHVQARGRMAQTAWPIVACLAGILLFLAAFQNSESIMIGGTENQEFYVSNSLDMMQVLKKTAEYVAWGIGSGLMVWLMIQIRGGEKRREGIGLTIGKLSLWFLSGALLLTGNFGTDVSGKNICPLLEVMAGVEVPGGFLRRVDLLFLSVLLFSLIFLMGSIFFYSGYIARRIHIPVNRIPAAVICFLLGTLGEQRWKWSVHYPDLILWVYLPVFLVITVGAAWARRKSYGEK